MKTAGLLVCALLLAGCSGGGGKDADALRAAEAAAAGLEVEATSSTGVIRGIVVDQAIRPVAGILVALTGKDRNQTTNELGVFGFDGLEPGTYFLSAAHADYATVQQSVEVVAGISQPEPVRIQVTFVPRAAPFIEALQAKIFIDGAFTTPVLLFTSGGFTSEYGFAFRAEVQPNGTVAQTEFVWQMTNALAENGRAVGGTSNEDGDVDQAVVTGPSPLVSRVNATDREDGNTADEVYYQMWAYDSAGVPAGVMVSQEIDVFIHVFHNFAPAEGWVFARDGAHPVPG